LLTIIIPVELFCTLFYWGKMKAIGSASFLEQHVAAAHCIFFFCGKLNMLFKIRHKPGGVCFVDAAGQNEGSPPNVCVIVP